MVTDELVKNVTEAWGQAGADWLDRLPSIVAEIEELWSVRAGEPFDLSYNYVAPAVREDGTEVVLKLGVPNDHYRREVQALHVFSGRGAVRLLKSDTVLGAMMLERINPGTYLGDASDKERVTSVAAGVMRRFWQPAPSEHQFPEVSEYEGGLEWLQGQLAGTGLLPRPLVMRAEAMLREPNRSSYTETSTRGISSRSSYTETSTRGISSRPSESLGSQSIPKESLATRRTILVPLYTVFRCRKSSPPASWLGGWISLRRSWGSSEGGS